MMTVAEWVTRKIEMPVVWMRKKIGIELPIA